MQAQTAPAPGNLRWLLLGIGLALCFAGCKPSPVSVASQPTPVNAAPHVEEAADPVEVLSALTDHKKLRKLKPEARSVNGRFDKILYWVYVADQKQIPPNIATSRAFDLNGTQEPRRTLAAKQIEASYLNARLWGLFTPENCARLKRGNAGLITTGSFIGQIAEVDHIVPVSRYPQFANELANLQLMPAMQNRAKGNRMGAAEFEKLKQLQDLASPTEN